MVQLTGDCYVGEAVYLGSGQGHKHIMQLPEKLQAQTLARMQNDPVSYEAHKNTIEANNALIVALGPGVVISSADCLLSSGMGAGSKILSTPGTFKRGTVTFEIGNAAIGANPSISINFPKGTFNAVPFAQVTQNGGNGALKFSYTESILALKITLTGTPTSSTKYTFQFAMRD